MRGRLDAGRDTALAGPGSGAVAELGVAAQRGGFADGPPRSGFIGNRFDQTMQRRVARQTQDVAHRVGLAPRHHLGAAIVTIAADAQPGVRPVLADPVLADAAYQATQMIADFGARGRCAGTQQQRHRAGGGGVIDMDRQKAAFVIMRIEQRHLLMPVHHVERVVDVQRHRRRWAGEAGAIGVDHGVAHADHLAQAGGP